MKLYEWLKKNSLMLLAVAIAIPIYILFFHPQLEAQQHQRDMCREEGGDWCLSEDEMACRETCEPNKYFFTRETSSGLFSSSVDVECVCGGEP